jgi:predicted ATPase/DNA-binding CsgD family transcriptional regulator
VNFERSRPPTVGVLPRPLSSFVGRERELDDLEALLAQFRLLTLTGPGGSGKTRLAIEIARRSAEGLAFDSAFVDLAPLSDPALVAATVATSVGIRPKPRRTLMETLVDYFAARPMVLILDNLEQLLPDAARTVAALLSQCPDLRVLTTSRAPLHVRGEYQYAVDPLAQAEAMGLFAARAQLVESRFALTEHNRDAIAEICERLDRLPLAIELAAAHSKLLTPQALVVRLEQRLSLVGSVAVDAPARQRTLRDTIAWSYGLLDPIDRNVFARLSGFVGSFSSSAAEAVVPDPNDESPIDVMASLARLVDNNLVRVQRDSHGDARFSMLETIREFAIDQVSPEQAEKFRERHATFFLSEILRQTDFGATSVLHMRLADELDNFRAALSWAAANDNAEILLKLAVAMTYFFAVLGHGEEAGHWLHVAEPAAASAAPDLQGALLKSLARHELFFGGDRRRAQDLLNQALRIAEDADDAPRTTEILKLLSHVASDLGDRQTAEDHMRRALLHTRSLNDPLARARFLGEIAASGHSVLDLAETKRIAQEAVEGGRELNDDVSLTNGLIALGYVAIVEGDPSAAVEVSSEAVSIQGKAGIDPGPAIVGVAIARTRVGDFAVSRSLLIDALTRSRELGFIWFCLAALEAAADWFSAVGDSQRAATYWAAVDSVRSITHDRTPGNEMGLFKASRSRVRSALTPGALEAAIAEGTSMTLDRALESAIRDLDHANVDHVEIPSRGRRGRHDLTRREQEVLELLAAGRSDGQIADELFISKKTAAVHVANIKAKLGAGSRVEIVTMALSQGLASTRT